MSKRLAQSLTAAITLLKKVLLGPLLDSRLGSLEENDRCEAGHWNHIITYITSSHTSHHHIITSSSHHHIITVISVHHHIITSSHSHIHIIMLSHHHHHYSHHIIPSSHHHTITSLQWSHHYSHHIITPSSMQRESNRTERWKFVSGRFPELSRKTWLHVLIWSGVFCSVGSWIITGEVVFRDSHCFKYSVHHGRPKMDKALWFRLSEFLIRLTPSNPCCTNTQHTNQCLKSTHPQ